MPPRPPIPATTPRTPTLGSFAVYVLSRGQGVPAEARAAQRRIRELVEADQGRGVRVSVATTRIGIEGESKLCVQYEDAEAGELAFGRATAVAEGVDLIRVERDPCGAGASEQ